MKLGKAIKMCREQKGLSRMELAELADVSISYLSLLENNKRDPSISKISKIADALNIPIPVLVFLATDKKEFETLSSELAEKFSLLSLKLLEPNETEELPELQT